MYKDRTVFLKNPIKYFIMFLNRTLVLSTYKKRMTRLGTFYFDQLQKFGLDGKLLDLVADLYSRTKHAIKDNSNITKCFKYRSDLHDAFYQSRISQGFPRILIRKWSTKCSNVCWWFNSFRWVTGVTPKQKTEIAVYQRSKS